MQRASSSAPSTPVPSAVSDSPLKRQKLSHDSPTSIPITSQDPIDSEDARIQAAIDRVAAEHGETKWSFADGYANASPKNMQAYHEGSHSKVISQGGLFITQASWADIDGRQAEKVGRRTYGAVKHVHKHSRVDNDASSSSDSNSEEDEDDAEDGEVEDGALDEGNDSKATVAELIQMGKDTSKAERKAARKAEKAAKRKREGELVEKEVRKKVKLRKLTSISGTQTGGGPGRDAHVECFVCGEKGHRKTDCPQRAKTKEKPRKKAEDGVSGLDY